MGGPPPPASRIGSFGWVSEGLRNVVSELAGLMFEETDGAGSVESWRWARVGLASLGTSGAFGFSSRDTDTMFGNFCSVVILKSGGEARW